MLSTLHTLNQKWICSIRGLHLRIQLNNFGILKNGTIFNNFELTTLILKAHVDTTKQNTLLLYQVAIVFEKMSLFLCCSTYARKNWLLPFQMPIE